MVAFGLKLLAQSLQTRLLQTRTLPPDRTQLRTVHRRQVPKEFEPSGCSIGSTARSRPLDDDR